jgi:replicative DNA helicase
MTNNKKEFSVELQQLFLEMFLADSQSFVRVRNIFNPDNFDRQLREVASFIQAHADEHKILPDLRQIQAVTGVELKQVPVLDSGHYDWLLVEFEHFTKRRELERAILKAADLIESGDFDPVEKLVKDAVQISLLKDMGTDYFDDPRARLLSIRDHNGQVSTGWPTLDRKLFGGMNRGELNIFAGGSGSGKSLVMQNLACNWVSLGLNGIYITLELSEGLCSMRIDSMLAGTSTKDIFKEIETVELKIKMLGKKSGKLQIKYLPAQSTINDIRAYVKELQIQTGIKTDFVMVDYLDLLMPVTAKVDPSNLFVKDKYVSEELRNLAKELNILLVTASQLNRAAVEEIEFDHSHISGGISKINTADNVFGIFTSRAMRERGRYQIQLMKTRSSSGVGQKVDLEFNIETLRILDTLEENAAQVPGSGILSRIKTAAKHDAAENTEETTNKQTGEIQSSKLRQMLNAIRTENN